MKRALTLAILGLLVLAAPGLAGDAGTRSPFSLGAGARDLALAGAVVTGSDPAASAYWNPALLARVDRLSVTGFHTGLFGSGSSYQYAGVAVPTLDLGGFGIGVFRLGADGIERRTSENLPAGQFGDSRFAVYAGYGRAFAAYDVGVALSLERHQLDDLNATSSPGLALGLGRGISTGLWWMPRLSGALVARDVLRPGIKLDRETVRYPRTIDAGLAADLVPGKGLDHSLRLSADLVGTSGLDPELALALDYDLKDLVHLRAGLRDGKASFGAGLSYRGFDFDYALVDRGLGSISTFSISAALGGSVGERRRARDEARDAQFNKLLETRLAAQNRDAVMSLVAEGERLATSGELERATLALDRARLLAGEPGEAGDTTAAYAEVRERLETLETQLARAACSAYTDSAEVRMAARDYLGARYLAELALSRVPDSQAALAILARSRAAIDEDYAENLAFENRLRLADSLVTYGKFGEALAVARDLRETTPGNDRVSLVISRAEFGYWQDGARTALARGEYGKARAAVDSALVRLPNQPACLALRAEIDREATARETSARGAAAAKPAAARPTAISDALRKDVDESYQRGQSLFKSGHLAEAVAEWEKVEILAPNYQSVRTYLVNAYKYLGVELYTQNHLQEAVDTWKKAAKLAPDSAEIANYIRRTEGEMARMKELSYETR